MPREEPRIFEVDAVKVDAMMVREHDEMQAAPPERGKNASW